MADSTTSDIRIYDDDGDLLLQADRRADRVVMLPAGNPREVCAVRDRIRIQWGQHLLSDVVAGRYRCVICAVNDEDNTHGIIGELLGAVNTSQWSVDSATSYAKMFHESVAVHAAKDQEPYILKYDLDRLMVLAILRPRGCDHFTLDDLSRGYRAISRMLHGRLDRLPVASVPFLGGKSNRVVDANGDEPSFESVLRTMFDAGYRGDVYSALGMWELAPTGVFASYPFPESLDRMRTGGF